MAGDTKDRMWRYMKQNKESEKTQIQEQSLWKEREEMIRLCHKMTHAVRVDRG